MVRLEKNGQKHWNLKPWQSTMNIGNTCIHKLSQTRAKKLIELLGEKVTKGSTFTNLFKHRERNKSWLKCDPKGQV